jgi:malonate transporter
MGSTFGALAPVFLMIALGWVLRARGPFAGAFWSDAERLVYWFLFPALLFVVTATSDATAFRILPVMAALIAAVLAIAGLTFALRPWLGLDNAAFTSVFQGAIRSNAYVGLGAASSLYGEPGLAMMSIAIFVVVTTVNILSVGVLVHFGRRASGWRSLLTGVAQNPLIIACVAGFALNLTGLELPALARETLQIMGRASLALGLLCVGAGLDLAQLTLNRRAVTVASVLKLLVIPSTTALFCRSLGVEGLTAAAAILFTAMPVSASSYILARQLEGDAPLMAALITLTTIAAVITVPLMLAVWV